MQMFGHIVAYFINHLRRNISNTMQAYAFTVGTVSMCAVQTVFNSPVQADKRRLDDDDGVADGVSFVRRWT